MAKDKNTTPLKSKMVQCPECFGNDETCKVCKGTGKVLSTVKH